VYLWRLLISGSQVRALVRPPKIQTYQYLIETVVIGQRDGRVIHCDTLNYSPNAAMKRRARNLCPRLTEHDLDSSAGRPGCVVKSDSRYLDPTYSALQILNQRFARGEIQKDQYTEKKTAILSGG
jgi:hypothetical protein